MDIGSSEQDVKSAFVDYIYGLSAFGTRVSSQQGKSEKVDGGTLFCSGKDDVENMLCLVQNCRGFELKRINVVGEVGVEGKISWQKVQF